MCSQAEPTQTLLPTPESKKIWLRVDIKNHVDNVDKEQAKLKSVVASFLEVVVRVATTQRQWKLTRNKLTCN